MKKQYHILNGDALKDRFPKSIQGELIVARECLVDGNVDGKELDQLYANRAKFLNENYQVTPQDYYDNTVTEFAKIGKIEDYSEVNLWFEDDLFCQVNFWFISYLLAKRNRKIIVYLIRPESHGQYGFGGFNESELVSMYKNRSVISKPDKFAELWVYYQNNDLEKLNVAAQELNPLYPFILNAVKAHRDRFPDHENQGRPKSSLLAIMNELGTNEFGLVFQEFCKRESIYGFGDLQVKRLFDEINKKQV